MADSSRLSVSGGELQVAFGQPGIEGAGFIRQRGNARARRCEDIAVELVKPFQHGADFGFHAVLGGGQCLHRPGFTVAQGAGKRGAFIAQGRQAGAQRG